MGSKNRLAIILTTFVILFPSLALALDLGTNITIYDKRSSTTSGWYGTQEDQEVEPGMLNTQAWDLEGFFLKGNELSLVSGFDFKNGEEGWTSGDIFIDTDGDARFGDINEWVNSTQENGNVAVTNKYGYDFVYTLDFSDNHYDLYRLSKDSKVLTTYFHQNQGSSPWRYKSDGTPITTGNFHYYDGLTDADTGFLGDTSNNATHYALTGFDLADLGLPPGQTITAHFTMKCGNDNLMGQAPVPTPEPATIILFGSGMIGVGLFGRRKSREHASKVS